MQAPRLTPLPAPALLARTRKLSDMRAVTTRIKLPSVTPLVLALAPFAFTLQQHLLEEWTQL